MVLPNSADQGFRFQDIHKQEGAYLPQCSIHIISQDCDVAQPIW